MRSILLRLAACSALSIVLGVLTGCGVQPDDTWGQAYVAPASLTLRRELRQKNSVVAVLKHGERVSILDVHRRYVKVRTDKGAEGWLDSTELLSPEQMDKIRKERQDMSHLPSEGAATVYDALNVHIEPSRQSPAFARIPEGGSVIVLGHRIAPKITGPAPIPILVLHKPELVHKKPKKTKAKDAFRLPPRPAPPRPPENWQELAGESGGSHGEKSNTAVDASKAKEPAVPVVMEDWTLIRTKKNEYGWVLSRNLMMSIPDEVAQYAEGKRITSYFDLGTVQDEEKGPQHNWLWTTLSGIEPYDFDSWRVFLWNRRRHRYETSYRARDVVGYFPVHVDPPDSGSPERRFQLITKDDDGVMRLRTYLFDGVRVHLSGAEVYHPETTDKAAQASQVQAQKRTTGWFGQKWLSLKQRLSGHSAKRAQ